MEVSRCLYQGDYARAIAFQHQCLEQDPDNAGHYWRLGILYCLTGDDTTAQETWFSVLSQVELDVYDQYLEHLAKSLQQQITQLLQWQQIQSATLVYPHYLVLQEELSSEVQALSTEFAQSPSLLEALSDLECQMDRWDEALAIIQQAIALDPDQDSVHNRCARIYQQLNQPEKAIAAWQTSLSLNPAQSDRWTDLGNCYQQQQRGAEALHAYQCAVEQDANNAQAWAQLAWVYGQQIQPTPMLNAMQEALKRNAQLGTSLEQQFWSQFQQVYAETHPHGQQNDLYIDLCERHATMTPEAIAPLDRSLATLAQSDFLAHPDLTHSVLFCTVIGLHRVNAHQLKQQGQLVAALDAYEHLLVWVSDSPSIYLHQGDIYSQLGQFAEAKTAFQRALFLDPSVYGVYLDLARIHKFREVDDPLLAQFSEAEQDLERNGDRISSANQISLHFALGKVYDDLKQYDRAFHHFAKGAALKYVPELASAEQDFYDYTERFNCHYFSQSFLCEWEQRWQPTERSSQPRPIFIIGMPRSGSTLIEKILSSHPDVYGIGESTILPGVFGHWQQQLQQSAVNLDNSEQLAQSLVDVGDRYRQQVKAQSPDGVAYVTDKMLSNFFYVGFIHVILPDAIFIHCDRHPLDTCLSCFQQLFVDGADWTYDLQELSQFYQRYHRMMRHWRAIFPNRILDVQYETLVNDVAGQAQRILDHCQLPWNDACIQFHQTTGRVETASLYQVRQTIYRSSLEKWRNYEIHLQPLVESLQDILP